MSRSRWATFERLIDELSIRPILAVVPENCDPDLVIDSADPQFWTRLRAREAAGDTIALHGYRHIVRGFVRGLVPLHKHSEFAGVALESQRAWVQKGLEILRDQGLHPKLWVAPRHGFDKNTLRALREAGVLYLSDGFTARPVECDGVVWIPQQLWAPEEKNSGLWTICIHSNTADAEALDRLRAFLDRRSVQFTSFDRAIADYPPQGPTWCERVQERLAIGRILASRRLRVFAAKQVAQ
jgi:predicted deacetylase